MVTDIFRMQRCSRYVRRRCRASLGLDSRGRLSLRNSWTGEGARPHTGTREEGDLNV